MEKVISVLMEPVFGCGSLLYKSIQSPLVIGSFDISSRIIHLFFCLEFSKAVVILLQQVLILLDHPK